jgi:hypothetical protein
MRALINVIVMKTMYLSQKLPSQRNRGSTCDGDEDQNMNQFHD